MAISIVAYILFLTAFTAICHLMIRRLDKIEKENQKKWDIVFKQLHIPNPILSERPIKKSQRPRVIPYDEQRAWAKSMPKNMQEYL